MPVVDAVVLGGWIAFWIYWLVAATRVKAAQRRSSRWVGVRVGIVLVVLLLLRTGVFNGHANVTHNHLLQGIGLALFVSGLGLAVWARRYLGRNWGSPMSQRVDPELVTTGPYRKVRHPIYSGIILAMIGTTVAVSLYWVVGVGILGAYFIYSATVEERDMAGLFPETYPEYKRSTKMLIPFIF